MSGFLMTVLSFLLLLGLIVLIHELGHYLGCRLTGVHVEVFSLGFGKRLWGRRWKGTDFRISLFPIGGYVRMAGDEPEDGKTYGPHDYMGKNRAQRILVVAAGPLMNFILAFLALALAYWGGVSEPSYRTDDPVLGWVESGGAAGQAGFLEGDLILAFDGKKVANWADLEMFVASSPGSESTVRFRRDGKEMTLKLSVSSQGNPPVGDAGWVFPIEARMDEVVVGEAADRAGMKPGDTILKVNGTPVRSYHHFMSLFQNRPGERLAMVVKRDGADIELQVTPGSDEAGKGRLGVRPVFPMKVVAPGLGAALVRSGSELKRMASLTLDAFRKLLVGKMSPKTLSGPLEIARYSRAALASGWQSFLILVSFISLQLGLVNLFPLPALDGGNLLIFTVEAIIRRDLSLNMKIWLMNGSFLFLMGLMAFVLLNDIAKILPSGWASFWPF